MWGDRGRVVYCGSQDLIFAILRRSFFQLSSFYEFCDLLASRETARDVICSLIFNTGTQIYVLFCLSCLTALMAEILMMRYLTTHCSAPLPDLTLF